MSLQQTDASLIDTFRLVKCHTIAIKSSYSMQSFLQATIKIEWILNNDIAKYNFPSLSILKNFATDTLDAIPRPINTLF